MKSVAGDPAAAVVLGWAGIIAITSQIAKDTAAVAVPDVIAGILRGGMIPAISIAHALGVREVRAVDITCTASDAVNADKARDPRIRNPASLGDLSGLDVLLVDDVAGTGQTMRAARGLVSAAGARAVRTAVCVLNETNWKRRSSEDPAGTFTHVGAVCRGWVVFPWENQ